MKELIKRQYSTLRTEQNLLYNGEILLSIYQPDSDQEADIFINIDQAKKIITHLKKFIKHEEQFKMTRPQAREKLFNMWENGEIPNNFIESHSNFTDGVRHLMEFGYLIKEELF